MYLTGVKLLNNVKIKNNKGSDNILFYFLKLLYRQICFKNDTDDLKNA